MWEKFIAKLIELGVIADEKKDQATEIGQQMDKETASTSEPTRTTPGMIPAGEVDKLVQKAVGDAVSPLVKRLDEEMAARKRLEEIRAEEQQKERAAEIKTTIEKAEKEGRITSAEAREKWQKRLEENFSSWSEALTELPANPSVNRTEKEGDGKKPATTSSATQERGQVDQTAAFEAAVSAFSSGGAD